MVTNSRPFGFDAADGQSEFARHCVLFASSHRGIVALLSRDAVASRPDTILVEVAHSMGVRRRVHRGWHDPIRGSGAELGWFTDYC